MTLRTVLRRRRLIAVAVLTGCAAVATLSIWRAGGIPPTNAAAAKSDNQIFQERIRKGLGSEVRFSTAKDSEDAIKASIESVAVFIHSRSGMIMSDQTKSDLVTAEAETLAGKRPRISIETLTNSLTAAAAERVATLSDKEIENVASTFRSTSDGQVTLRMAGALGEASRKEVVTGLTVARDSMRRDELESSIRLYVDSQISDRASSLSQALPEQFGRINTEGVTPSQAVLITYSVASDDQLADSQSDLARQTIRDRMNARLTRSEAKAQRLNSPIQYGRSGSSYSSPVQLLLNRGTIQRLLNPEEGGKGK